MYLKAVLSNVSTAMHIFQTYTFTCTLIFFLQFPILQYSAASQQHKKICFNMHVHIPPPSYPPTPLCVHSDS